MVYLNPGRGGEGREKRTGLNSLQGAESLMIRSYKPLWNKIFQETLPRSSRVYNASDALNGYTKL